MNEKEINKAINERFDFLEKSTKINKVRNILKYLSGLVILDVILTYILLLGFNDTIEMNPILTTFGNTLVNVVLSHIFALILLYIAFKNISKENNLNIIKGVLYSSRFVLIFYIFVTINNLIALGVRIF